VLRKPQSGAAWHPSAGHYGYGRGRDDDDDPAYLHPALTAQEMAEMDPADLTALSVEVVTFC
jgi:hypothetical protein